MLIINNLAAATEQSATSVMQSFTPRRARVAFGESLADVVDYVRNTPRVWRGNTSTGYKGGRDWTLGHDWDECLRLAHDGWQEGMMQLEDSLALVAQPRNEMHYEHHDVAGEYVDPVRFAVGDPSCMVTRRKLKGHKPVVRLVVNGSASASATAKEMMNYGAALVSLVNKIESSGRRVELDVTYVCELNRMLFIYGWNVKHASDHLDLSAVAFSLAHPGAFRRLGFAMMERCPIDMETSNYGYSTTLARHMLYDGDEGALLINGIGHAPGSCRTMADAVRFAAEQINKAAGEELVTL
jgi:hypothetical protein